MNLLDNVTKLIASRSLRIGTLPLPATVPGMIICIVMAIAPGSARALQSDSKQPIDLTADRAELDDLRGISTYTGKVKLTQGSILLTGDIMIVESSDGVTEMITTTGKPAHFQQRPDNKPDDIVATAKRIKYDPTTNKMFLDGKAVIVQGNQKFRGEHIVYDMMADKIKARAASGSESGGRVHITLPGNSN